MTSLPPIAASLFAHIFARGALVRFLFGMGLFGLFFIAVVDSSFIPLPIPGCTDIFILILAAKGTNWLLLTLIATAGSMLGGWICYQAGLLGGMPALESGVPKKYLDRICRWADQHAILAVSLPAILPPPMPLIPFVLAAGALKMPQKKFMIAFTVSRAIRHAIAAGLGIFYGPPILRAWNHIMQKWSLPVLIALWTVILGSIGFAIWRMWKKNRKQFEDTSRLLVRRRRPIAPAA